MKRPRLGWYAALRPYFIALGIYLAASVVTVAFSLFLFRVMR